jgi:DNA phosphorothioation-dependent restriction protein DptH
VNDILRLSTDHDAAAIAHALNLRRLEVAAILAHQKLQATSTSVPTADSAETKPSLDFWNESEPAPVPQSELAERNVEVEEPSTGIYLGEDSEFETRAFWNPADAQEVQNPHLMIMGESGSGKTYAAQCLVAELAQSGMPSIIFDYGQSFEIDKLDPTFVKYCQPKEHLLGEVGLGLNPLQIFPQDARGPNTVATRLADVFDAAFRLGDIQKKVFIDAVLRAYGKAGIVAQDSKTWSHPAPSLSVVNETIEDLAADRQGYPSYRNAAGLGARLTTFFMLVALKDEQWSWDALTTDQTNPVHVLQFRGLEGKTRRVLVELLLWHMFFHFKSHGQNALRVFCVLDEAHHLSFRENGPIDALLREARKFGLGIMFASQQPQDFSPVAYSNTASKLIFQTSDPDLKVSKFLASKSMNFDGPEEIHDIIASLQQGHAFFITRNRGHNIRISDFSKRATQWNK